MHEWSLVFFTTISQIAAGIMIAILPFVFAKTQKAYPKLIQTAFYSAAGLMFIALILSFLHLNNPLHSVYALSNLGTSWLSREILFVSLFLFCLVFISLIPFVKKPKTGYYKTFILITTLVGIVLIYSMAMLYIIPTVPAWNSPSTMIAFYSTVLLLGSAFVLALAFHFEINTEKQQRPLIPLRIITFHMQLAVAAIVINSLFPGPATPEGNIGFEPEAQGAMVNLARWATMLIAAGIWVYVRYKKDSLKQSRFFYYLPFIFFLISELIARSAFYASFYNIGL